MKQPRSMEVNIDLNWEDYPEETELIHNIIKAGNLGSLLYVTVTDIITGRYDMQDSQTQNLLDNVIKTVTSIYQAMSGMDENVLDLVGVVNNQVDAYAKLSSRMDSMQVSATSDIEDIIMKPVDTFSIDPEDIGFNTRNEDEEGLDIEGLDDLFML